jgi:hypothetical protein
MAELRTAQAMSCRGTRAAQAEGGLTSGSGACIGAGDLRLRPRGRGAC